jgi:hypothetical protein
VSPDSELCRVANERGGHSDDRIADQPITGRYTQTTHALMFFATPANEKSDKCADLKLLSLQPMTVRSQAILT